MIDRLKIRMYRMGFGDCFLLTFSSKAAADKYVLIDCGSITEGKGQVSQVAQDVIRTCTPAGGGTPRIELVVATHRHRDHVGGFTDDGWSGVEVGEVWMPWTEDPADPDATSIRNKQSSFAATLAKATALAGGAEDDEPMAGAAPPTKKEAAARALSAIALNALTNEKAMALLHGGFRGRPARHFLPVKGTNCEARKVGGLPGVTIHVLGPPRDKAALGRMDPPKGSAYLRARAAAKDGGPAAVAQPSETPAFGHYWQRDRAWFDAHFPESPAEPESPTEPKPPKCSFDLADQKAVDDLDEEPDGSLAAAIDRAVNNTSLMLMFEVEDQWLLFPGDAQWGNWNAALTDPACLAVMKRTTFYKVGHHGSHNATPKTLVEEVIGKPFTAFLPTTQRAQWPNVPRPDLVTAIAEQGRYARSDNEAAAEAAGFKVETGLYIEWDVAIGAG